MSKTILYVEDDADCMPELLVKYFEREGYFVAHYWDGQEACDAIESGTQYGLIIADLSLPKIDGKEVIALSKRLHPETPAILTSGYVNVPGQNNYADAEVRKPFFFSDLEKVVKKLLKEE
jgi:CheY-like chemotaxis protein